MIVKFNIYIYNIYNGRLIQLVIALSKEYIGFADA